MSEDLLAAKAHRYYLTQQALTALEKEYTRLDAAVECLRAQQEEVTLETAEVARELKEEEKLAAAFSKSVPSYVLTEDIPNFVATRSALVSRIIEQHRGIVEGEAVLRAEKERFAAEQRTLDTLEEAKAAATAHGNGLVRAVERLTAQLIKETAALETAANERERLEGRLKATKEAEANAARTVAARQNELRRAKDAVAAAGEAVANNKALVASTHRKALRDAAHAEEQAEWLRGLTAENARLRAMLGRRIGEDGVAAVLSHSSSAGTHAPRQSALPPNYHEGSYACSQGLPSSCASPRAIALSEAAPQPIAALLGRFKSLNDKLLAHVATTVHMMEQEYSGEACPHAR